MPPDAQRLAFAPVAARIKRSLLLAALERGEHGEWAVGIGLTLAARRAIVATRATVLAAGTALVIAAIVSPVVAAALRVLAARPAATRVIIPAVGVAAPLTATVLPTFVAATMVAAMIAPSTPFPIAPATALPRAGRRTLPPEQDGALLLRLGVTSGIR